jgi:uncharacterized protein YggE
LHSAECTVFYIQATAASVMAVMQRCSAVWTPLLRKFVMPDPGIIHVDADFEESILADGAILHIIVSGESFFYGNAALEKSRELKEFVNNLKSSGVEDSSIQIKDIQAFSKSGLLGTSSSARYTLAVKLPDLSLLPNALGQVTGQKNINLTHIEWRYSQEEAQKEELLKRCTELALKRARTMAEVAGGTIKGIKSLADSYIIPKSELLMTGSAPANAELRRAKVAALPTDIGTNFSNEKKISVHVSAEFYV